MERLWSWIESRVRIAGPLRAFLFAPLPPSATWLFTLGSVLLLVLILQAVTGVFLAFYYVPTPDHAHDSLTYLEGEIAFGRWMRGLHYWGASFMVVVLVLHLLRVFVYGAYKPPRELVWLSGVGIFLLVLAFAFTGYLLPWDQKAYWATVVGVNIVGTMPLIGPWLQKVLQGGDTLGALTLSRFFAIHALVLPALILPLVVVHLFLQRRVGISGSWREDEVADAPHRKRAPFFPDQVFRDSLVAFAVLLLLIGAAAIWGAPLEAVADPTDTDYVPRPDWYFLGLFQLLKYFAGPLEVVGTIVIPGLGVALLVLLPFLDRNPSRFPRERVAALTAGFCVTALVVLLTALGAADRPPPEQGQPDVDGAPQVPSAPPPGAISDTLAASIQLGREIFEEEECLYCHTLRGAGGKRYDAPDLWGAALRHSGERIFRQIKNPRQFNPTSEMQPVFRSDEELSALTRYVQTLW